MSIAILQNHPAEGPARIQDWADFHQIELINFNGFEGSFPSPDESDGLVIMGGPNSVHDAASNQHIAGAIACVRNFLESGKPVLGICLGAQMMAIASGGDVVLGIQKEIGWYPLTIPAGEPTSLITGIPDQMVVCHWHGEQIVPPAGSLVFASTPACPAQALQLAPNQLALQCHLEVSEKSLEGMATAFADELAEGGPGVQSPDEIKKGLKTHGDQCFEQLSNLLGRLFCL